MVAVATPATAAVPRAIGLPATTTLPNATVGSAYTPQTITATGCTGSCTVTVSGAVPTGMTFPTPGTNSVTLSGTPSVAGSFSFLVTANDSTNAPVSKTYTLFVAAGTPSAPTIGTATAGPGDGQATVAFTASTTTGGAPLTYTATSTPGSHAGTCTASPCAVSGLSDGTSYRFSVTASNGTATSSASALSNSVVPKRPQTITFANPGSQTLGTSPTFTATSSSGLAVSFTSSTTPICTITTAGKLTLVTPGTCTINANQAGNSTYQPAQSVTQSFMVRAGATVTVTSSTAGNASVYGQPVTFTATFNPALTGQVQWSVGGTNVGAPVAVNSASTTFTPTTALPVGADVVKASYLGDTTHGPVSGQLTQNVSKANTTTVVQVTGDSLVATVAAVAPGGGVPAGTVTFTVNGASVGSAPLGSTGVATLTSSNVGQHAVTATYGGSSTFNTSTGSRSPIGPTVIPHITSQTPKRAGWHRTPVFVFFSCTPNTAPIVGACPGTVTLSRNGFGQSVTVTVTATDGGSTTVTVRGINIDKAAPRLHVVRHGTRLSCRASDGLSGVASCRIHRSVRLSGVFRTVRWTAVARDRAGNVRTKHGVFEVRRR